MPCRYFLNGKELIDDELTSYMKSIPHEKKLKLAPDIAANSFNAISWTPGEAQAARYDLSKQVNDIGWNKSTDIKDASIVRINTNDGKNIALQLDKSGKVTESHPRSQASQFEGKYLSDVVGKEIADKILNKEEGNLSGEGLKIGGEGMHAFYDKMLVDKANAIAKKFGGKVEQGQLNAGTGGVWDKITEGSKQPIHVLKITPELRDAALNKGFSLFVDTGKVGAPLAALTKVEGNPFKATAFHGSPHPLRGERIENAKRYEIDFDQSSGNVKYQVYDKGLSRHISEPFATKQAAQDWLDKRVGTEFYSTPNPKLAEDYASQNPNAKGMNITPLRIDISDYHNVNAMGKTWDAVNTTAIREAELLGKKGIVIKNVLDDADPRNSRGPQTVYITLDPSTVRSKFAKFDPKHFGESGLLKAGSLPLITDKDGNQLDKNLKPMFTSNGRIKLVPISHDPFKGEK